MRPKFISDSLVSYNLSNDKTFRLFCFPHAGGGASYFREWAHYFNKYNVEIISVQLPGRENRIKESPVDNLDTVVTMITKEIKEINDKPFAFFGHSMGSILSYEVCKRLIKGKEKVPEHLFLSSFRAPHLKSIQSKTYNLPEDELIGKLEALNGTPQQILSNNDLRKIFLPVIRADFKIAETYQEEVKSKLPLPITCMLGDNDTLKVEEILPWAQYTEADFTYEVFTGDHFYLNTNLQSIVDCILLRLKGEVQI